MSDRAIADHLGVDHKTVSLARDRLESTGEIPQSPSRTGADGRVIDTAKIGRPAKPNPEAADDLLDGLTPEAEATPVAKEHLIPDPVRGELRPHQAEAVAKLREQVEPSPSGKVADPRKPVKDLRGSVVPSIIRDVFSDCTLAEARDTVKGWLDALAVDRLMRPINAKLKAFPHLRYEQLTQHLAAAAASLRAAFETIDAATAYAYCPRCKGVGCDECRNAGYLPRHRYEELHGGDA